MPATQSLCLPALKSNFLIFDIFSWFQSITAIASMRGLSKQNWSKSKELCRFLKDPVDLDKKDKVSWTSKKNFLLNTGNFRMPVSLDFKQKMHLLNDGNLMKNLFVYKLIVTNAILFDKICEN